MTKLNPILLKPRSGWSSFCIDNFSFPVSYLKDTPQDIIDALVDNIKHAKSTVIDLDGEGIECTVIFCHYSGIYTIVNNSDNDDLNNNIDTQYFDINIKRFAERFVKDIEENKELWANWK